MASVSGIALAIEVVNNGPNLQANVTVEYDISFSSYDQHSNQPYTELCRLIGDDTGITPAEDGVDDSIPGGQLFPAPGPFPFPLFSTIASEGRVSVHRVHAKSLPLSALNEDRPPVPNPDELRAQVTLTPVLPVALVRESNQVALNIA
jgi:hypothetical protein